MIATIILGLIVLGIIAYYGIGMYKFNKADKRLQEWLAKEEGDLKEGVETLEDWIKAYDQTFAANLKGDAAKIEAEALALKEKLIKELEAFKAEAEKKVVTTVTDEVTKVVDKAAKDVVEKIEDSVK